MTYNTVRITYILGLSLYNNKLKIVLICYTPIKLFAVFCVSNNLLQNPKNN